MKWTIDKIARNMGVNDKTIRRWLDKSDDPAISTELSEARLTNHKRYIEDAYEICFAANEIVKAALITVKVTKATDIKAIATTMGIYLDKIGFMEGSSRSSGQGTKAININIIQSGSDDGHTTRVMADPIQVHDVEGEIHGDNFGSGSGEDVLRLPSGCEDSDGVSG